VVGGMIPYRPGVLGVQKIIELPKNCYGSELVSLLAKVDRLYNGDATIVADLTNDPTYAEPLFDMFGPRVLGVHIGRHGDGSTWERRLVRNSSILVYQVGRTYLFDRLLSDLRSQQIRLPDDEAARRLYEQLTSLEVVHSAKGTRGKRLSEDGESQRQGRSGDQVTQRVGVHARGPGSLRVGAALRQFGSKG